MFSLNCQVERNFPPVKHSHLQYNNQGSIYIRRSESYSNQSTISFPPHKVSTSPSQHLRQHPHPIQRSYFLPQNSLVPGTRCTNRQTPQLGLFVRPNLHGFWLSSTSQPSPQDAVRESNPVCRDSLDRWTVPYSPLQQQQPLTVPSQCTVREGSAPSWVPLRGTPWHPKGTHWHSEGAPSDPPRFGGRREAIGRDPARACYSE